MGLKIENFTDDQLVSIADVLSSVKENWQTPMRHVQWLQFCCKVCLDNFLRRAKRIAPGSGWSFWLARNERARLIELGLIVEVAQRALFTYGF